MCTIHHMGFISYLSSMATKPRISRSVVSTRTTKSAATKATTPSSSAGKSSPAQRAAAQKNIKKAQAKWKSMTHRQHALAQPQGKDRKKP